MIWNVSRGEKASGRFPSGAVVLSGMIVCALLLLGSPTPAMAQSSEVRALVDRINRLEKDLTDIQRQMYNSSGGAVSRPTPTSPATSGGSGSSISPDGLNLLMQRISALEDEQRRLTGAQEETAHKIDRLSSRLDKLVQDVEFRLTDLESRLAGSGGGAGAGTSGGAAAAGAGPTIIGGSGEGASEGRNLGTLAERTEGGAADSAGAATAGGAMAGAGGQLPSGSAMEQYNYAISLVREDRYAEAEVAFREFLQNHKDSELAGNAQYWLGETFYVRGDFPNAASAFFEGYQNYPDSSKAADNLLKLAMSLGRMDQQAEACATFAQMEKQFPQIPTRLRQTADREKQKYGCS